MDEITERGIIERVKADMATIRVMRHSACEHCDSKGACDIFEGKEVFIDIPNTLNAKIGDEVEISVTGGSLLKLSIMVYFLPVLALVLGAFLGGRIGPHMGLSAPLASILAGGAAMGITFLLLRLLDRSSKGEENYAPRMTRIVAREPISHGDSK